MKRLRVKCQRPVSSICDRSAFGGGAGLVARSLDQVDFSLTYEAPKLKIS